MMVSKKANIGQQEEDSHDQQEGLPDDYPDDDDDDDEEKVAEKSEEIFVDLNPVRPNPSALARIASPSSDDVFVRASIDRPTQVTS